jgi:hypothetical protein
MDIGKMKDFTPYFSIWLLDTPNALSYNEFVELCILMNCSLQTALTMEFR